MNSMQKTLFLLSGLAGSGKSTVAKYLIEKFNIKNYSLGDSLKEVLAEVSEMFDQKIELSDLYDPENKTKYRYYMQHLGTDILRKYFGPDIFNHALEIRVNKDENTQKGFIIDDVRFENEYNYWVNYGKEHNFKIVDLRIVRGETTLKGSEKKHISEQLLGVGYKYKIENTDTIEKLYRKLEEILITENVF